MGSDRLVCMFKTNRCVLGLCFSIFFLLVRFHSLKVSLLSVLFCHCSLPVKG